MVIHLEIAYRLKMYQSEVAVLQFHHQRFLTQMQSKKLLLQRITKITQLLTVFFTTRIWQHLCCILKIVRVSLQFPTRLQLLPFMHSTILQTLQK